MRVAAIHHQRALAESLKALFDDQPALLCHAHQCRSCFEVEPRIRWKCNGFVLHGGVDVDDGQGCDGHRLGGNPCFDGEPEHELTAHLTDARAKACHLLGINRGGVLEVLLATEVLPRR